MKIACTEKGRATLITNKIVGDIKALFDDGEVSIRNNAYVCLINLAEYRFGIDNVIDSGIIPTLIDKLVIEKEE